MTHDERKEALLSELEQMLVTARNILRQIDQDRIRLKTEMEDFIRQIHTNDNCPN